MISYVLPLLVIIFCYSRMIIKIVSSTKDKSVSKDQKKTYKSIITKNGQSSINYNERNKFYHSKIVESPNSTTFEKKVSKKKIILTL